MEDSTVSRHIMTSKGHTCLRIPEPLRRDTVKPPALSLFHEETEVDYSSDENEHMCKETIPTSPVPSLSPIQEKRNIKRKLEFEEFEVLPHTTPEHGKASFKQLQSFWESQSGGKNVKKVTAPLCKSKVTTDTTKEAKSCESYESPIDKLNRRHCEIQLSGNTPAKSAKQLALEYTQLVESMKKKSCANNEAVKVDANRKHNIDIDRVYEFNDEDVHQDRMSLKHFRNQKCETPMKASDKKELVSPLVFDSHKFHVIRPKKTPSMKKVPGSANKQSRYSQTELKELISDSKIMPPPSDIPKCLSAKKIHTPSPNNSPKWKKSAERSCQPRLNTEPEYSPNDLTPPAPNTGVKRKRNCKKRLLSMDVSNYSLLFSPTDHGADSNTECSVTSDNDSFEKTYDSLTDISLSEISAIKPHVSSSSKMASGNKAEILVNALKQLPPVDVNGRLSEDSFVSCLETRTKDNTDVSLTDKTVPDQNACSPSSNTTTVRLPSTEISIANQEKDSFLDLTVTEYHKNDRSVVNINNLSAIEPADRNADEHIISFEFSSPQVVGVSGGRKRFLLDKAYTTLNESVLSDMENSMVNPEPVAEVCDVVSKMAGKIVGFDDSRIHVDETKQASQKEDDYTDLEEFSKDTPVNDVSAVQNDGVAHGMMISASNDEKPVSSGLEGNDTAKETDGPLKRNTFEVTSICKGNNIKKNNASSESDSISLCVDKSPETDQSEVRFITPSESFSDNSNSLSTEYDYIINSPPALQIDLSAVGEPSPQTGSKVIMVTKDTQYEPSGDIVNLDFQMSGRVRPVKQLKDLSIESLGNARSQIYQNVMQQKMSAGVTTYLSLPLVIDVNSSVDIDCSTETQIGENHFSYLAKLQSELKDPCYSPNLLCDESPDLISISNKVPPSRSFLCWFPTLNESDDLDSFIYSSSDESHFSSYSSCSDDDPEYINALYSSRKDLKRPRRLVFESDEDRSDCYTPSPKMPRTPLTITQFEFPCDKNVTACDQIDKLNSVKCAQSLETKSDSGEMKDFMKIETELLERSIIPDIDYPNLLNSSVAYLDQSNCFFSSTTESDRSDSESSLDSKESADYKEYVNMEETFPVYTQDSAEFKFPNPTTPLTACNPNDVLTNQSEKATECDDEAVRNVSCVLTDIFTSQSECVPGILSNVASVQGETDILSPTSLMSVPSSIQNSACMPNTTSTLASGCVSPKPLDMRICDKQKDQGQLNAENGNLRNGLVITTPVHYPGGYKLYEYGAEPQVAILENNNSAVWKEIGVGNFSYSYSPSKESSQYAMNCYNNAVFGCVNEQLPVSEPDYIATPLQENLYINNSVYSLPGYEQSVSGYGQTDPQCVQNNVHPTYMSEEPRQMYYNSSPITDVMTVPYEPNTRNRLPLTEGITVPLSSHSFPQAFISPPHEQFNDKANKVVNAVNKSSNDGYEISGDTSASCSSGSSGPSSSETEPDIMKHMVETVRNRLIEKAGNWYITAGSETFELSESLKHVRPYVISGWISSTYLMALAKKKDLVNDMFENALDEKGEIQEWIVENCRSTTPAVLARDLVFRLFTLEELENLNLVSLARKKRFKAIRKCVEKLFPAKLTRKSWQSCLNLIKSSVSTLFKHRLRQVQNFLMMHAGL